MDLKRYRVNNIQEALQLIKKDLGPEAVIVSTRQVKEGKGTFGLFGKTVLEVTAALDQEQKSAPAKTPPTTQAAAAVAYGIKDKEKQSSSNVVPFRSTSSKIRNRSYFPFKRMSRN
jgi:Flagellar GTP-binding protein